MNDVGWDVNGGWYLCLVRGMHGLGVYRRAREEQEEMNVDSVGSGYLHVHMYMK